MKLTFIISIFLMCVFYFLSCSKTEKTDVLTFQFDKQATLIVKSKSNNNEHSIVGRYLAFLSPDYTNNYKFADTLNTPNQDDLILSFKISGPTEASLIIDEYLWLPVFLVPDDTLYMSLDISDSSEIVENIRFDGKYASINEYRIRRFENFRQSFEDKCAEVGRNDLSVVELQNAIDSVTAIELNFFNNYLQDNSLPNWYINYERNQIIYRAAFDKTYKVNSWKWNNIEKAVPQNYYEFMNNIKINNEGALICQYYYYFLWQYFYRYLPDEFYKMDVSERRKNAGMELLKISDSLLSGEVKDVFKSFIISQNIIDNKMFKLAEENIELQKSEKTNLKYVEYLENYLKDKLTLNAGVKAPDFYLIDTKNKSKSLSDFKGSILLLNFWFPGCMPCINEIPFEKKLVDELQNENFILVNICLFSSEENWRKTINKFEMKGEHLFANVSWQNKLETEYKISSYPHYTLIDKEGKVHSNNPKRPSEGIKDEILKLLNN